MKAVVVLSGGQDSATALALAVRKHGAENVAAITFEYGQRHALETKFARRLARRFIQKDLIIASPNPYKIGSQLSPFNYSVCQLTQTHR